MIESGLDHIRILEDNDFFNFKISCKASDVFMAAAALSGSGRGDGCADSTLASPRPAG